MLATPMNGLSAVNASLHYGQNVNPVRPVKKVNFADMMVVPVSEKEAVESGTAVKGTDSQWNMRSRAMKAEAAYRQVAEGLPGSPHYSNASMQGEMYDAVGFSFDAMA